MHKPPKKSKPSRPMPQSRPSMDNESIESPMNEGMEKNLKKEPEYQAPAPARKNYKGGKGWCGPGGNC